MVAGLDIFALFLDGTAAKLDQPLTLPLSSSKTSDWSI